MKLICILIIEQALNQYVMTAYEQTKVTQINAHIAFQYLISEQVALNQYVMTAYEGTMVTQINAHIVFQYLISEQSCY